MSHLAPMRVLNRPTPTVSVERRADGSLILSAGRPLPEDLPLIIDWLERAALQRPNVTFLAERRGAISDSWRPLSYGEAWARDRRDRLVADRPGPGAALAAGRDPVGQQPRTRAVPVRRAARRCTGRCDLASLCPSRRPGAPRPCAWHRRAGAGLRAGRPHATLKRSIVPRKGARASSASTAGAASPLPCWRRARSTPRSPNGAATSWPKRRPSFSSPRARPARPRRC